MLMKAPSASPTASKPSSPELRLAPLQAGDVQAVWLLVDRAFGPGRFAKTAARLREGSYPRLDLSVAAWREADLVGAVTIWPIRIGDDPALFLGPIAVHPDWRGRGLAREMSEAACAAAAAVGEMAVLLVGDQRLFGPVGFERVEPGRLRMPGPVDPRRLLWRGLDAGALEELRGTVRIAPRP